MGCTHSLRGEVIKALSQIDQSLLIPKGGTEDTAEDGPDAGDAGGSEAIMAEEQDEQKSQDQPKPTRARVRDLVDRLMQAVPEMTPIDALAWLEEITWAYDPTWAGKLRLGQFASDELVEVVEISIATSALAAVETDEDFDPTALMEAELADEADDAEVEPVDDEDDAEAGGDELSANEDVSTDVSDGLEPWKQQLLEFLTPARQARTHDDQIAAADDLAEVLHYTAFPLYREQGLPDEVIVARLAQRRNGSVVTAAECKADKVAYQEMWVFRTAFWMVRSDKDPVELLREFELPVLKRSDHHQRSGANRTETRQPDDAASHSADAASKDSDSQAEVCTEVSDRTGEADVEGQPSAGDSDRRRDLSTRRGDTDRRAGETPPKPKTEDGQGEAAAATSDKPKQASPPPTDQSTSGSDAEPRPKSDESILAYLPDNVIEAAIQAVLDDDDPEQAWAYRSPETVRSEADRRLLLEYGQHAAA